MDVFAFPDVGGVHGDMIRNIPGWLIGVYGGSQGGAFYTLSNQGYTASGTGNTLPKIGFDPSRVVPTGNANKPRAFGVLPCVYLGVPK